MVGYIKLKHPRHTDMDNPIEDAAFMARIGAILVREVLFGNAYQLKNAATGTRFTFEWSLRNDGFELQRND